MSGPPMKCPHCGLEFEPKHFVSASPGDRITFSGNKVTCPRCGGMAEQVEHGTFEMLEGGRWHLLASALRPQGATRADYQRLLDTLEAARHDGVSTEQVAARIQAEAPTFSALGQWLVSQKGLALAQWLAVIVPVLLYILQAFTAPPPAAPVVNVTVNVDEGGPSEDQIQEWIEQAIEANERP